VTRRCLKLSNEGKYPADVEIELHYSDDSWSPTVSANDARKLETVMLTLRRGCVAEAAEPRGVTALDASSLSIHKIEIRCPHEEAGRNTS